MTERWISPCGQTELRLGDYREVLADVLCQAVITDPPYSARTHLGNETMEEIGRRSISYGHWNEADVRGLAEFAAPRCSGRIASMTDHVLIPDYEAAMGDAGLYHFAPVPILQPRFRKTGDGPASCAVYLMVDRPKRKEFLSWGSLQGWYEAPVERGGHIGGKPLCLMRAIVRDYSKPGDLICDPCAGRGTTLKAAAIEGRRAIGSESDPVTFHKAVKWLSEGYTPQLF